MNRRQVLIGAGGMGTAVIGGFALTNTAAAEEVETGLFAIDNYHIDSQSGRLEYLTVENVTVAAKWKNFEHTATAVDFKLEVTVDGDTKTAGTASVDIGSEHHGDTDYEGYVQTGMEPFDLVELYGTETFEVPHDYDDSTYTEDITKEFDVSFTVTATVHDDAGNSVDGSATGDSLVFVRNLGADVDVGGTGEYDGLEEQEYDAGPVEGGVDELDGVTFEWWPHSGSNIFEGEITNENSHDVLVTVTWQGVEDQEFYVEADSSKSVTSPPITPNDVSGNTDSAETPELRTVEEAGE